MLARGDLQGDKPGNKLERMVQIKLQGHGQTGVSSSSTQLELVEQAMAREEGFDTT